MDKKRIRIDSGVNAVLAIWVAVSHALFTYDTSTAVWNGIAVAALLLLSALIKAAGQWRSTAWNRITFMLGLWLVISPFALGYAGNMALLWNAIIVGVIITVLSWRSATASSGAAEGR